MTLSQSFGRVATGTAAALTSGLAIREDHCASARSRWPWASSRRPRRTRLSRSSGWLADVGGGAIELLLQRRDGRLGLAGPHQAPGIGPADPPFAEPGEQVRVDVGGERVDMSLEPSGVGFRGASVVAHRLVDRAPDLERARVIRLEPFGEVERFRSSRHTAPPSARASSDRPISRSRRDNWRGAGAGPGGPRAGRY